MKRLFALLATVVCTSLYAETIGYVEYELPASEIEWKVINQLKNEMFQQTVYAHEKKTKAEELFGVHWNNFPKTSFDPVAFKQGIQANFPDKKIEVTLLEKGTDWAICEWSARSQDNQYQVFGIARAFSSDKGNVLLSFQSEQPHKRDTLRPLWLTALKNAHPTN